MASTTNSIQSGRIARSLSNAQNLLVQGVNTAASGDAALPARAFMYSGATTVKGVDGENVVFPDTGSYTWVELQITELVSTINPVIVIW